MMDAVCLIIRRAPYGKINAAEAVRHVNGALASGLEPVVILVGDGVYLAKANQQATKAGWTSLSDALCQIPSAKGGERARFYVHQESLADRGLAPCHLMEQFKVVSKQEAAGLVAECPKVLLF
jgi:sulfur relay (sulfurtransferase) DsrF/TusC family protein